MFLFLTLILVSLLMFFFIMKTEFKYQKQNMYFKWFKLINNLLLGITIFLLIRWELMFLEVLFVELMDKVNKFEHSLSIPESSGVLQKQFLEILLESSSSLFIGVCLNSYLFSFEDLESSLLFCVDNYYFDLKLDNSLDTEKELLFNSFSLDLMELFLNKKTFVEVFLFKKSYSSEFMIMVYHSYFPASLFLFILFLFIFIYFLLKNK